MVICFSANFYNFNCFSKKKRTDQFSASVYKHFKCGVYINASVSLSLSLSFLSRDDLLAIRRSTMKDAQATNIYMYINVCVCITNVITLVMMISLTS